MQRPVTELNNELCGELDGAVDAASFLRMLQAADSQVFGGYKQYPSILSPSMLDALSAAATTAGSVWLKPSGTVIMAGCGTSGRVAWLTARRFASLLGVQLRYAMAGGDSALLLSDELPGTTNRF